MTLKYLLAKIIEKLMIPAISNSKIDKTSHIGSRSIIVNSTIGKYSYCGNDSSVNDAKIGAFCSISHKVLIGAGDHPFDHVSTSPAFYGGKNNGVKKKLYNGDQPEPICTTVGNDVWIGYGALIKSGVSIGNGAIIAMGSVVTKDVAPYAIVAGNPAKVIKFRFPEDIRLELERTTWWALSDSEIRKLGKYINNPHLFIKYSKQE